MKLLICFQAKSSEIEDEDEVDERILDEDPQQSLGVEVAIIF